MEEGKDSREITVADIYTISPFGNRILTYAITGKQMAQQLERALVGLNPSVGIDSDQGYQASNLGDRFAGIRATYKVVDGGIQILSIMTEDGKSIDVNDTTKTYNVYVNEYCATLPDSVFKDLKPHTLTLESRLAQLKEEVAKFDESKLTKEDQEALTMLKEELNTLLAADNLTAEEKTGLETLKTQVETLLAKLQEEQQKQEPKLEPEPIMMWMILAAAGAAGIVTCVVRKRKIKI